MDLTGAASQESNWRKRFFDLKRDVAQNIRRYHLLLRLSFTLEVLQLAFLVTRIEAPSKRWNSSAYELIALLLSYLQVLEIRHPEEGAKKGVSKDYSTTVATLPAVIGIGLLLYSFGALRVLMPDKKKVEGNTSDINLADSDTGLTKQAGLVDTLHSIVAKCFAVYTLLVETSLFLPSFQSSIVQLVCNARGASTSTSRRLLSSDFSIIMWIVDYRFRLSFSK